MASRETNTESAFPVSDEQSRGKVAGVYGGMTLRDYFAARIAPTLIDRVQMGEAPDAAVIAVSAYRYADAMLAARYMKGGAT